MAVRKEFFARDSRQVALELLNKYVVRDLGGTRTNARITWTEAYAGKEARDGPGIEYEPGLAYIYMLRGNPTLNVATGGKGNPQCVIIHEGQIDEMLLGPISLARELRIDKTLDGKPLYMDGSELRIEEGSESVWQKEPAPTYKGGFRVPRERLKQITVTQD